MSFVSFQPSIYVLLRFSSLSSRFHLHADIFSCTPCPLYEICFDAFALHFWLITEQTASRPRDTSRVSFRSSQTEIYAEFSRLYQSYFSFIRYAEPPFSRATRFWRNHRRGCRREPSSFSPYLYAQQKPTPSFTFFFIDIYRGFRHFISELPRFFCLSPYGVSPLSTPRFAPLCGARCFIFCAEAAPKFLRMLFFEMMPSAFLHFFFFS